MNEQRQEQQQDPSEALAYPTLDSKNGSAVAFAGLAGLGDFEAPTCRAVYIKGHFSSFSQIGATGAGGAGLPGLDGTLTAGARLRDASSSTSGPVKHKAFLAVFLASHETARRNRSVRYQGARDKVA